jgi:hypothetical protein
MSATNSSGLALTFSTTSSTCSVSGTTLSFSGPGNCVVSADHAGNTSYAPGHTQQTIAVRRVQTINWPAIANAKYGDTFPWNVTTSAGATPTFDLLGNTSCDFPTANTLRIYAAGQCAVRANHPGDEFSKPVQDFFGFIAAKAPQSITFGALGPRTLGSAPFTVSATGGPSGNPIVFSSLTTPKCTVSGNTVTLVAPGTCTIAADLAGDTTRYLDAPRVTQGFQVAALPNVASTDFNHDGKPDLVWSNTTNGATYIWRMNGLAVESDQFVALIDPSWKVQGIADFNGDGHPDLVWRNTETGNCYVWYLAEGVLESDAFVFSLPPEWVIQGVADFNADGKPDFLMRNTVSGNAFAWFFNDATAIGDQFLFGIDPSWKVEAVGDIDLDGQPDLLFRNTVSGLAFPWNTAWSGSALTLDTAGAMIFSIDPAWEVAQLADWNADGKPDLLFRNKDSGLVFVWYLDGLALAGSDFVISIDPSWEIVPRR